MGLLEALIEADVLGRAADFLRIVEADGIRQEASADDPRDDEEASSSRGFRVKCAVQLSADQKMAMESSDPAIRKASEDVIELAVKCAVYLSPLVDIAVASIDSEARKAAEDAVREVSDLAVQRMGDVVRNLPDP